MIDGYFLMKDGKFVCKNNSNNFYLSKTDIQNAKFYLHRKNAENILQDCKNISRLSYGDTSQIDPEKLEIVKVELSYKII